MGRLDRISNLIGIIEASRCQPGALALIWHADRSSVRRFFVRHFGMPPCRCLKRYRIAKALTLMELGSLGLKEIAALCGYDCLPLFCRHFKEVARVRPSHWREIDVALWRALNAEAEKLARYAWPAHATNHRESRLVGSQEGHGVLPISMRRP